MPGFDRTGPVGKGSMTGGRRGRCVSTSTGADITEQQENTGRGAGFCTGFEMPGLINSGNARKINSGYGRGGRGSCGGRGFRNMNCVNRFTNDVLGGYPTYYSVNMPADSEKELLRKQAETLENQLQWVKKRLNDADGGKELNNI